MVVRHYAAGKTAYYNTRKTKHEHIHIIFRTTHLTSFICIGADKSGNVTWSDVISWTEVEELKIEFRDEVPNVISKVDEESLVRLAEWAEPKLRRYIKPEFTDKFKHLSVRPSTTSMIITAVIILLITIGICVWVVKNEFQE